LVKMPSAAFHLLDVDLAQVALGGIHRELPQLFGVHLTEALVALDLQALAAELLDHARDLVPAPDRARVIVLVLQRQRLGFGGALGRIQFRRRRRSTRETRGGGIVIHSHAPSGSPRRV
jgi:hypothetical protein